MNKNSNHHSSGPAKQTAVLKRALAHFVSAFRDRGEARSQALALVEQVVRAVDQVSPERENFRKVLAPLFSEWCGSGDDSGAFARVFKDFSDADSAELADWYFETENSSTREAEIRSDIFDFARNEHGGEHHDLKNFREFISDVLDQAPESA